MSETVERVKKEGPFLGIPTRLTLKLQPEGSKGHVYLRVSMPVVQEKVHLDLVDSSTRDGTSEVPQMQKHPRSSSHHPILRPDLKEELSAEKFTSGQSPPTPDDLSFEPIGLDT